MSAILRASLTISMTLSALAFAMPAYGDMQEDFFRAVQSGQIERLTAQMRPELLVEIDEPVLAAWMNAVNERLGSIQSMSYTGFELKQTDDGTLRSTTATVKFSQGTATSELTALDGRLIGFNVTSDDLGDDWFQGPTSVDLYQEMGRTFILRFMTGRTDDAYAMCHEALQEVIDRDSFQQMIDIVQNQAGALKSIEFRDSRMELADDEQNLLLNFDFATEKGTGTCEIKVQFVGMKGYLLGFNFE